MPNNLANIRDALKKIMALTSNPHWTAERRWRVEAIARGAFNELDAHEETPADDWARRCRAICQIVQSVDERCKDAARDGSPMPSTVSELSVVELDAIYKIACGEIDPHGPTLEVL